MQIVDYIEHSSVSTIMKIINSKIILATVMIIVILVTMEKQPYSGANKRFSVGLPMSWRSEWHFEAPVSPGKLHVLLPRSTKNGENQGGEIFGALFSKKSASALSGQYQALT